MAELGHSTLCRDESQLGYQTLLGEVGHGFDLRVTQVNRSTAEQTGDDTVVASARVPHRTLFAIDQHLDLLTTTYDRSVTDSWVECRSGGENQETPSKKANTAAV